MADVGAVNTVVHKPTDEDVCQENQHDSGGVQFLPKDWLNGLNNC